MHDAGETQRIESRHMIYTDDNDNIYIHTYIHIQLQGHDTACACLLAMVASLLPCIMRCPTSDTTNKLGPGYFHHRSLTMAAWCVGGRPQPQHVDSHRWRERSKRDKPMRKSRWRSRIFGSRAADESECQFWAGCSSMFRDSIQDACVGQCGIVHNSH